MVQRWIAVNVFVMVEDTVSPGQVIGLPTKRMRPMYPEMCIEKGRHSNMQNVSMSRPSHASHVEVRVLTHGGLQ
jgi:hypothetical protein